MTDQTAPVWLQPARIIPNPGPEYHGAARQWQGIPGIERATNGRLWATWYTGGVEEGPGNHVVLVTSDDDGITWSEPVLVIDPGAPRRAYDPCLWHDPLGRLWLFWAQCTGPYDGRAGVWALRADDATDARPEFSGPRWLANGIMMNKPTVLSTGEWLLPIAVWVHGQPVAELAAERFSNVFASTDQGASWVYRGSADVPERWYDEHMVVERRDGSLWMLVRTKTGIGESCSTDRGFTWSPGRATTIWGPGTRFFIRRLRSGRLLLINHDPQGHPEQRSRRNLTAWLSDDDGVTWGGGLVLDDRDNVSYPDGIESADGRQYIIYDHNRGDRPNVARGGGTEREILMAMFTEADVQAGRLVEARSRLRVIVNKAPDSK